MSLHLEIKFFLSNKFNIYTHRNNNHREQFFNDSIIMFNIFHIEYNQK